MKAKKTIRKMAHRPLARELAKLQRDMRSTERKLTRLVELADTLETENRAAKRMETELRERLARAGVADKATGQPKVLIPNFNSPTRPPDVQLALDSHSCPYNTPPYEADDPHCRKCDHQLDCGLAIKHQLFGEPQEREAS